MQSKGLTISVGIPAYNEEGNIGKLISQILSQKQENFSLEEIIIISDASTDKTVDLIRKLKNPLVKLIDKPHREGKSMALNNIFSLSKGRVVVLLDADVSFRNNRFLFDKLISLFESKKTGIAAVKNVPVEGLNLIEKSINFSVSLQEEIKVQWKDANNYLCFRGSCLLIDGDLVKKIVLPRELTNDDAYLYFESKRLGYNARYFDQCEVFYRSPASFRDYLNQVSRFKKSENELGKYLDLEEIEYKVPKRIIFGIFLKGFFLNPLYFFVYGFIFCLSRITNSSQQNVNSRSMATSTKQI